MRYFGCTALQYEKYAEIADAMAEIDATTTDHSKYLAFLSAASAALSVALAVMMLASAAFASASAAFLWTSIASSRALSLSSAH